MLSKQVMVRNLRRGQTFCLIPVTHPACEPPLVLGLSLGRKCYYKESAEVPGSRVPQNPKGKLFLALPEAKELAETGIKQCVHIVQAYR